MSERRDTKGLILDAAEAAFCARSYEAVSMRDIGSDSGLDVGLITYHFATKKQIFEEVVRRRAPELNAARRKALQKLRDEGRLGVSDILGAFVRPYFDLWSRDDEGWKNYCRLLARLVQVDEWEPLVERLFNPSGLLFIDALDEALPDLGREKVTRAFVFSVQLMSSALGNNRRLHSLYDGSISSEQPKDVYAVLFPFMVGGFEVLARESAAVTRTDHR